MNEIDPRNPKPYKFVSEYLDAEFSWLRAYVAVRDDEDPAGKMVGRTSTVLAKDITRRFAALRAEEKSVRDEIDARLAVHRQIGAFKFGLDLLVEMYGLGEDDYIIGFSFFRSGANSRSGR